MLQVCCVESVFVAFSSAGPARTAGAASAAIRRIPECPKIVFALEIVPESSRLTSRCSSRERTVVGPTKNKLPAFGLEVGSGFVQYWRSSRSFVHAIEDVSFEGAVFDSVQDKIINILRLAG